VFHFSCYIFAFKATGPLRLGLMKLWLNPTCYPWSKKPLVLTLGSVYVWKTMHEHFANIFANLCRTIMCCKIGWQYYWWNSLWKREHFSKKVCLLLPLTFQLLQLHTGSFNIISMNNWVKQYWKLKHCWKLLTIRSFRASHCKF